MSLVECLDRYPVIGFIGGNVGIVMMNMNSLLTDESTVNIATNLAMYTGWFVAIVTGMIKTIELYDRVTNRWRRWRAKR